MPRSMLLIGLLSLGCADLTMPISENAQTRALTPTKPATPAKTAVQKTAERAPPKPRRAVEKAEERVSASHILVAFKGSRRAKGEITRSKEEGRKRAEEVRNKARKGGDFAALAKEYSDGPSAGKGGDLGSFGRGSMVKPFSDAVFALEVNGISDVVETEFGFHVIKRTK